MANEVLKNEAVNEAIEPVDAYLLLNAAVQLFEKVPADLSEDERQQAAELAGKESLMQAKILDADEAVGITVDDAAIAASMKEIEERYPSHADFLSDLVRNGLNEGTLKASLIRTLKVDAVMEKVAESVVVSDDEVSVFYNDNLTKFEHSELREASHILITINPQFPENRRKAVKSRLKKIAAQLADKPDSFADLAMRHSECPTALEGGFLGKLPKAKLYPELDRQLFAMGEGEISGIVESPVGFHIIRCTKIHEAGTASLEEAEPMIREHLLKQRVQLAQKQWIRNLFNR